MIVILVGLLKKVDDRICTAEFHIAITCGPPYENLSLDHLRNFPCHRTNWSLAISHHKLPLASHVDELHHFIRIFHNVDALF